MSVLVLGIGNLLMGDEGIGCRVAMELGQRYQLPEGVDCLDGGTAGFELLPLFDNRTLVILIDALQTGREPGTIVRIEGKQVPRAFLTRITPHQLGISDVLATASLAGTLSGGLELFGIEPQTIELGAGLSPAVEASLEKTLEAVVQSLRQAGYEMIPTAIACES